MAAPAPYIILPGTAREALTFYRDVFGGQLTLHTFGEFSREDGAAELIAHGLLHGDVDLFAADAAPGEATVKVEGLMFSLLGAADPTTLHQWFDRLAERGTVLEPLEVRPWGAADGQVVDRFGVRWLLGYERPD